jgi:hypothetical protein
VLSLVLNGLFTQPLRLILNTLQRGATQLTTTPMPPFCSHFAAIAQKMFHSSSMCPHPRWTTPCATRSPCPHTGRLFPRVTIAPSAHCVYNPATLRIATTLSATSHGSTHSAPTCRDQLLPFFPSPATSQPQTSTTTTLRASQQHHPLPFHLYYRLHDIGQHSYFNLVSLPTTSANTTSVLSTPTVLRRQHHHHFIYLHSRNYNFTISTLARRSTSSLCPPSPAPPALHSFIGTDTSVTIRRISPLRPAATTATTRFVSTHYHTLQVPCPFSRWGYSPPDSSPSCFDSVTTVDTLSKLCFTNTVRSPHWQS